jgi:hypothetical protein
MVDQTIYNSMLEAADSLIQRNLATTGRDFANYFMSEHDPRNGPAINANIDRFYRTVLDDIRSQTGGANSFTTDQLFAAVGRYLKLAFDFFSRGRPQQSGYGVGYNQQPQPQGYYTGPQPSYNPQQPAGIGSWQSPAVEPAPFGAYAPQQAQPVQPVSVPKPAEVIPMSQLVADDHPLSDLPESGVDFSEMETGDAWGGEHPRNRTIVVTLSKDVKTRDPRFLIRRLDGQHRVILDDPIEVVKDFFKIAPEALLAKCFMFRILYNHLEIIDVPTQDFVAVRDLVLSGHTDPDVDDPVYRLAMKGLSSLSRGSWKAFSKYLVEHVNRALYLSARLSGKPTLDIQLGPDASGIYSIDDLEVLLSSSFKSSLTAIPEGRTKLKKIVETAIWNALSMNSGALFTGDRKTYPTTDMLTSPVFPYALRHVYPEKTCIPDPENPARRAHMAEFIKRMNKHELSEKTYIVSKRSVVVTNMFSNSQLNAIGNKATRVDGIIPGMFNRYAPAHLDHVLVRQDFNDYNIVKQIEDHEPEIDTLGLYYSRSENYDQDEDAAVNEKSSHDMAVDQVIFAIPFGSSHKDQLKAFDVLSAMDEGNPSNSAMLVSRKLHQLKVS